MREKERKKEEKVGRREEGRGPGRLQHELERPSCIRMRCLRCQIKALEE